MTDSIQEGLEESSSEGRRPHTLVPQRLSSAGTEKALGLTQKAVSLFFFHIPGDQCAFSREQKVQ